MKYFKLKEFVESNTAKSLHIDNTPSKEVIEHINELVDNLLDPLREAWAKETDAPEIRVTSGYRCPELNKAVGGVTTSLHQSGYAADLVPMNGKTKEFIKFCQTWIKDKGFDQCINEYDRWCHIGYKNSKGQQRKMVFKIG